MTDQRPTLFIDAMNLFARHYIRNPALTLNGTPAGGVVGFLNSLMRLVDLVNPKSACVVWEGGGSARKRAIFPGYKEGRKPPRLNRYYEKDEIPDTTENRIEQIRTIVDALHFVPVNQLFIEDCEADDVIGFLCRNKFKHEKKIIASSDKDFYQLLDENTMIYSWTTKSFVGPNVVLEEYGIHANNFAVAKAIVGDPSDCVPGVQGVGFKTLAKRFPMLAEEEEHSWADVIKESKKLLPKKLKAAERICESHAEIERNWRLMYLDASNLAAVQVRQIDAAISNFRPTRNKLGLMRYLIDEGLATFDAHDFFSAFLRF